MRLALPRPLKRLQGLTTGLGRNIGVQVAINFFGGAYRGGFNAIWQPFVLSLGSSVRLLGVLETIGGWGGIVSCLFQLLGGWLADRVGRRPVMIFSSLFTVLAMACYVLAALLKQWTLLIPGIVLAGMGLVGRAAGSSVTAESASVERRGMAFSLIMVAFTLPSVLSSVVSGQVSERWGYVPVMLAAVALEGLVLLTLLRFLRETLVATREASSDLAAREGVFSSLGRMLIVPRKLWRVVVPLSLDSLTWGTALSLLFGLLKDGYHFTDGQIGVVNASFSLAWGLSQIPVGWLVDRHGCKVFLVVSEGLSAVSLAILLLWPTFAGAVASYGLLGFTAALWVPALYKLLAAQVDAKERGKALGQVFTFQSLARFPAPFFASLLYEWGGFNAPLWVGLGLCLVVIALISILMQDPPDHDQEAVPDSAQ